MAEETESGSDHVAALRDELGRRGRVSGQMLRPLKFTGEQLRDALVEVMRKPMSLPTPDFLLRLTWVEVDGVLDLSSVNFDRPIEFDHCELRDGFRVLDGKVRSLRFVDCDFAGFEIADSTISGVLVFRGCSVLGDCVLVRSAADSLDWEESEFLGFALISNVQVLFQGDFRQTRWSGGLSLQSVKFGGVVQFSRARIRPVDADFALEISNCTFEADLFLDRMRAHDGITVRGSTVGGQFDLGESVFETPPRTVPTVNLPENHISGALHLCDVWSSGAINAVNTAVGGQINLRDLSLRGGDDQNLDLQGVDVGDTIFFAERLNSGELIGHFLCEGTVVLRLARVKRDVIMRGLVSINGSLSLESCVIEQSFRLEPDDEDWLGGSLSFRDANIRILDDNPQSWKRDALILDGFEYSLLKNHDWPTRRAWLRAQHKEELDSTLKTQPWTYLASYYRSRGHPFSAREILFEMETLRGWNPPLIVRGAPNQPDSYSDQASFLLRIIFSVPLFAFNLVVFALSPVWRVFLEAVVGYGHRSERSLLWLAVVVGTGAVVFASAYEAGALVATTDTNERRPSFNALAYSLDVFLPIIDLGLRKHYFAPSGWVQIWTWIEIGLGWLLSTTAIAGFTGLLRQR